MNPVVFNLKKIKELTEPIEDLQIQIDKLNNLKKNLFKKKVKVKKIKYNGDIINKYEDLLETIEISFDKLNSISIENLNTYLFYHDNLIKKYKEQFKKQLKQDLKTLDIKNQTTRKIGISLIENKRTCKIVDQIKYIPSIHLNQWLDLIDSLKNSSIFIKTVKNLSIFYDRLIEKILNQKLDEIPKNTDSHIVENYKNAVIKNPTLTFIQYIKKIEDNLSKEDLKIKKEIIKKTKEMEEIEKLKLKQQEQQEAYQNYLELSNREFERLRRKRKREKLNSVKDKPKNKIEISKDISKKIKDFKSQFEKSFTEKHLNEEAENQDPLKIIRERKKKKDKEFKKYKKHFEND